MPRRPGPRRSRAGPAGKPTVIQQQPESSPGASSRPCARDAPSRGEEPGEEPPSSNLSASTVSAEKWHTTESPPVVFRQAQLR